MDPYDEGMASLLYTYTIQKSNNNQVLLKSRRSRRRSEPRKRLSMKASSSDFAEVLEDDLIADMLTYRI
jgi:hypothetical protein